LEDGNENGKMGGCDGKMNNYPANTQKSQRGERNVKEKYEI
jgi:hypothetical protein